MSTTLASQIYKRRIIMKKAFFSALALVLCFVFMVGCGSTNTSSTDSNSSSASTDSETVSDNTSSDTSSKLTEEQMKMSQYLGTFSQKIDQLNANTKGKFVFGLQSDTHHSDVTKTVGGNNIVALSHFVEMDFIGHLGDIIRGYSVEDIDSPENMRACMDDMVDRFINNSKIPVMMTVGNHDTNSMWCNKWGDHTTQITPAEQKTRIFDRLKEYNGDKMITDDDGSYYYIDFPEDGIRVSEIATVGFVSADEDELEREYMNIEVRPVDGKLHVTYRIATTIYATIEKKDSYTKEDLLRAMKSAALKVGYIKPDAVLTDMNGGEVADGATIGAGTYSLSAYAPSGNGVAEISILLVIE